MAPLITLDTAKAHLGIRTTDRDGDIWLKLTQAQAEVLTYLKRQVNTIASISVANPAVITTLTPHGFTSGGTYAIADTTTTPTVNGARVVTVIGAYAFTVPVNVTVGQSAEAGTAGVDPLLWTDSTAPPQAIASILINLAQLVEWRGDGPAPNDRYWKCRLDMLRDPALA